jgi:hypothetical protein
MKGLLISMFLLLSIWCNAQKLDSLVVSFNGVTHTVFPNDTVHLGYGKNPYGSFQFISFNGTVPLEKEFGGRKAVVLNIRYYKALDKTELTIKFAKNSAYYKVLIPQAFEIGEIVGINGTMFKKE